ncbi:hypothetical protein CWC06_19950, partial [Pseudoalteromonas ruthenica]
HNIYQLTGFLHDISGFTNNDVNSVNQSQLFWTFILYKTLRAKIITVSYAYILSAQLNKVNI